MKRMIAWVIGTLATVMALVAFGMAEAGGKLSGIVLDQSTGKPVGDVTVVLEGTAFKAVTDSTGTFVMNSIPEAQYTMIVVHTAYQTQRIESIEIRNDQPFILECKLNTASNVFSDTTIVDAAQVQQTELMELDGLKEAVGGANDMVSKRADASAKSVMGRGVMAIGGAAGFVNSGVAHLNPPNGQKYADMYHHDYGTNPFIDTDDDHLSTFGMDVSTGSYALVRNYINNGSLPPKDAVRTEEFVNYFRHDYLARMDSDNESFSVQSQAGPSVISRNTQLVQILVRGKEIKSENRKPAVLTFVVDVSGSMNIENRLGLVKKTLSLIVKNLRSSDKIGIVSYGTSAQVVLEHTGDRSRIEDAVNNLYSEGSTNAEAGLRVGYQLAARYLDREAINRVVLCTDGVANNGETSSEGLLRQIDKYRKQGISLTACGFGMGNYNDILIEQLATKGDGSYYYIDNMNEAKRVFVEQLTGTLQVIAKDAKIQVEFDKEVVSRYRLLGYEKRDIADEDFRNDTVDGGEVGSGHTVMALYELKLKKTDAVNVGHMSIRYKSPDGKEVSERRFAITLDEPQGPKAKAGFQFVSAVALYSEIMRESYWVKKRDITEVRELVDGVESAFKKSLSAFEDFQDLVRRTIELKKAKEVSYEITD